MTDPDGKGELGSDAWRRPQCGAAAAMGISEEVDMRFARSEAVTAMGFEIERDQRRDPRHCSMRKKVTQIKRHLLWFKWR